VIVRFARPYAKAFLGAVGNPQEASTALADLQRFARAMEAVPRIAAMAQSPSVPQEVKQATVAEVAARLGLGRAARSMLGLLIENYRLASLAAVVEAIEELLDRRLGRVKATVTAAEEVGAQERDQLQRILAGALGQSVGVEVRVAPELLGGFVAQVGSRRYDASLRGQLERMSRQLAEAGAQQL
jgi:F-type H+-transporting ATPase subunit delta